jgi:uncharacterized protein HemY
MTERHWVDADEALEDAARKEGAATDAAREASCLDRDLDDATAEEMVEDGHQAGD